MPEKFTIPYESSNNEAYINACYSILVLGNKKPKKNEILSYPNALHRLKRFAIIFGILFLILDIELLVIKKFGITQLLRSTFPTLLIVLLVFAIVQTVLWLASKKAYQNFVTQQKYQPEGEGLLTIDANGIRDEAANGNVQCCPWSQYDSCIITPRAIVIRSKNVMQTVLPSSQEVAQQVGSALTAYGYGNTIHVCILK